MLQKIIFLSIFIFTASQSVFAKHFPYEDLIVFGDSLSDMGNRCSGSEDDEYKCLAYPLGRFTDGEVYVEHIARRLNLTISPSIQGGNNFAFAGATSGMVREGIPGLTAQFRSYLERIGCDVDPKNCKADPNALYVIWIGGNDFKNKLISPSFDNLIYQAATKTIKGQSKETLLKEVLDDISNTVTFLSRKGARHFLIPNLPPVFKTPIANIAVNTIAWSLSKTAWWFEGSEERKQFYTKMPSFENTFNTHCSETIQAYNHALSKRLKKLEVKWNVTIHHPDSYKLFEDVVNNYSEYGLESSWDLTYDFLHPTAMAHKIIGESFYKQLGSRKQDSQS